MSRLLQIVPVVLVVFAGGIAGAGPLDRTIADRWTARHAARMSWHDPYHQIQHSYPIPLVVPPTANVQSHWTWGVTGTEMTPIHHQFSRPYPDRMFDNGGYRMSPTPINPWSTRQGGVYYIRAPW